MRHSGLRLLPAFVLPIVLAGSSFAQADLLSTLRVRVDEKAPLKTGATVVGRTIEDFHVHDTLVVPSGTRVIGQVTGVKAVSRKTRLDAMTHGDFTPLREPQVRFTQLRFSDGHTVDLDADSASAASETVRFYSRGAQHPSLVKQLWSGFIGTQKAAVKAVTAPGKKDRLEDYFYHQLPWHPQEIEEGTVYEMNLRTALEPIAAPPSKSATQGVKQHSILRARLVTPLDSAKVKQGDPVQAIVTSPAFDAQQQVDIPQGTILLGHVVKAKAAKRFGRNGGLRFTFDKLQLPEGTEQQVNGVAKAVDSNRARDLAIDNEGGVEPSSNKSILAPLAVGLLAASALTEDEAPLTHAATSSNGFGLIARGIAIGTKSNIFGGVLGGMATTRMIYTRFIEHGKDVKFDRGTGIEVDLGPSKKPMETPAK